MCINTAKQSDPGLHVVKDAAMLILTFSILPTTKLSCKGGEYGSLEVVCQSACPVCREHTIAAMRFCAVLCRIAHSALADHEESWLPSSPVDLSRLGNVSTNGDGFTS